METQNISRRNFIKLGSMTGAALSLGFYFPSNGKEIEILKSESAENLGVELNAWITIDPSGKVTLTNHRAEMGQGSFQSVAQIIAEELEVDLNNVSIVFSQGNPKKNRSQVTVGRSTVRVYYYTLFLQHLSTHTFHFYTPPSKM